MTLGTRLRYYRQKKGLTLEQLSEMSQVDVGTISALELRGSVRSKFAPALAKSLGLTVEQLVDESRDWLDPAAYQPAVAAMPLRAEEAAPVLSVWPFPDIDQRLVSKLKPPQINQLQGAMLLAAAQLGITIAKRAAA